MVILLNLKTSWRPQSCKTLWETGIARGRIHRSRAAKKYHLVRDFSVIEVRVQIDRLSDSTLKHTADKGTAPSWAPNRARIPDRPI